MNWFSAVVSQHRSIHPLVFVYIPGRKAYEHPRLRWTSNLEPGLDIVPIRSTFLPITAFPVSDHAACTQKLLTIEPLDQLPPTHRQRFPRASEALKTIHLFFGGDKFLPIETRVGAECLATCHHICIGRTGKEHKRLARFAHRSSGCLGTQGGRLRGCWAEIGRANLTGRIESPRLTLD